MSAPATTRILVLGASGMLGNAVLRLFSQGDRYTVFGSARSTAVLNFLPSELHKNIICGVDAENIDSVTSLFARVVPDVVINCVGLVKQFEEAKDPLSAIPINSLMPHRVARLCQLAGARFLHISTDCVFTGTKGMYREEDDADAQDIYGRTKHLGEVDYPHAVTLRTSIIGHELNSAHGLVGWFLAQHGAVKGFTRAIFSGLPTIELARVIRDHVLPSPEMCGLYHVSAAPISKYELLRLIASTYGRTKDIIEDNKLVIDRSLDSTRFRQFTGYTPPTWPELIKAMHAFG